MFVHWALTSGFHDRNWADVIPAADSIEAHPSPETTRYHVLHVEMLPGPVGDGTGGAVEVGVVEVVVVEVVVVGALMQ